MATNLEQTPDYGTLYSLSELMDIKAVCRQYGLAMYIDGDRLAYALACPENDVTLSDIANLCDAFYIGGTKCVALFGEAVIIPNPDSIPHSFTLIKQHGALLAKGRLLGIQFDVLFTDDVYQQVEKRAIDCAHRMREILKAKGYRFAFDSPTNQLFLILSNEQMAFLSQQLSFSFWEKYDEAHTVVRLATSWATRMEDVEKRRQYYDTRVKRSVFSRDPPKHETEGNPVRKPTGIPQGNQRESRRETNGVL